MCVCDMDIDQAEVMWQESDAFVWNTLTRELETVIECFLVQEDDDADIEIPKRSLERVKKALMKLHTNLNHPGVKEMVRVLNHGRASGLAIQEARRMRCDVCADTCIQSFHVRRSLVKCWTSTNVLVLTF